MCTETYGAAYRTWLRGMVGGLLSSGQKPGIIFVNNIEVAEEIAKDLEPGVGVRPPVVSSRDMSLAARQAVADKICAGSGPSVVVATSTWMTGLDLPPVAWVVLDPGLTTTIPTIQSGGRGSRLSGGKSSYLVLVPPGPRKGRQLSDLASAGYDMGGPDTSVRLAVADAMARDMRAAQTGRGGDWAGKPLGWAHDAAERAAEPREYSRQDAPAGPHVPTAAEEEKDYFKTLGWITLIVFLMLRFGACSSCL